MIIIICKNLFINQTVSVIVSKIVIFELLVQAWNGGTMVEVLIQPVVSKLWCIWLMLQEWHVELAWLTIIINECVW